MTKVVPAYGVQRTALKLGRLDDDGYLREHPLANVWNLLRISGPMQPRYLAEAVAMVTLATDALHLRLRNTDQGLVAILDTPRSLPLELFGAGPSVGTDQLDPNVARRIAPLLLDKVDSRFGFLGRFTLVTGDAMDHLLAVSLDHTASDGWALGVLIHQIARCYRALVTGERAAALVAARGPLFRDFIRSLPLAAFQNAALATWSKLLADLPPVPQLGLPGQKEKRPEEIRPTGFRQVQFPVALVRDLAVAAGRLGLSRAQLLVALTSLVTGAWADEPQPMAAQRHGRNRRGDVRLVAPLVEVYVSLPPRNASTILDEWLVEHASINSATPPLGSWSIFDIENRLSSMVSVNVVPPARTVSFGQYTKGVSATGDFLEPLWPNGRTPRRTPKPLFVSYYLDSRNDLQMLVEYDPDVVPEPGCIIDGIGTSISIVAEGRRQSLTDLRRLLAD